MITPSELEQRRSPAVLREFVDRLKATVNADELERHCGILKKGLYKQFLDEIIPLSRFSILAYPENYEVQPVLGNQGYDALVFDESGAEVDRVEITTPHDGAAEAMDAKLVVSQGIGSIHIYNPGDEIKELFPHVIKTCRKKAHNDYSNCTLVVTIAPPPPFQSTSYMKQYEMQITTLASEISIIRFKAKRVFLLVLPDKLVNVQG